MLHAFTPSFFYYPESRHIMNAEIKYETISFVLNREFYAA